MRFWLSGPRLFNGLIRPGISLGRVVLLAVMQAKGMPSSDSALKEIVVARALTVLRRLVKRGAAVKSGTSRDARWVAPSFL